MACPSSEDQWASYYNNQTTYLESPFTNINSYDYSGVMTTDSVITTSSTHSGSPTDFVEPSSAASQKSTKRRSRASRKTPTTLLNANATNFRSLVQQFTGKPSAPSVITPGVHRGPLNINFGEGSYGAGDQEFDSSSGYVPFGSTYDPHSQQPVQYEQQSQFYQRGIDNTSFGVEFSNNFVVDGQNVVDDLDWGAIASSVHPWE